MRSRTAGAPSLPIQDETDLGIAALAQQLMEERGLSQPEAMRVARAMVEQRAANAQSAQMEADYNAATGMPDGQLPQPDLSNVDVLAGDEPGTQRVWNPRTGRYGPVRVAPRQQPPQPALGRRWGGGQPFASQAEADAYYERPALSEEQRREMVSNGATPEEIADAGASQYDRDARQAGSATHGGYAPVYVNGRVQMMTRAPTPLKTPAEVSGTDAYDPGSSDASAAFDFAQDMMRSRIDTPTPIPLGDDGVPVVAGVRPGTANAATGNAATGERADNRDVPPSLRRPDMEARGYQPTFLEGPNGGEWVYALPESAVQDRREADDARRQFETHRRLIAQSGLPVEQASRMLPDQLRTVIAANREREKKDRELLWRPRTMIRGGNAIGALALPGLDPGQQAAILGGARPLDVEAMGVRNALRMLEGANLAQGMFQNSPVAQQQVAEAQAAQNANVVADAEKYISDNFAWDTNTMLGSMFASDFTPDEQAQAAIYLSQKHRIPMERAQAIVSSIAARKRRPAPQPAAPQANPAAVGPQPNPINPRVPLAAPSRPPGV
jgi:hypothetical protein